MTVYLWSCTVHSWGTKIVFQIRASDDYQPGDTVRWRLGISSIVAYAVALSSYKDTFWTTSVQPGNYYNGGPVWSLTLGYNVSYFITHSFQATVIFNKKSCNVNNDLLEGTEPYTILLAAVSSLSAGPIGPGDMINGTNAQLLMRFTNNDLK